MDEPARRVLMATDVIAPGGGPAGYTFNLLQGFRALGPASIPGFTVDSTAQMGATRHRTVGVPGTARSGALARLVDQQPFVNVARLVSRVKWSMSRSDRARRSAYRSADVVVFQGYQSSARATWVRKRGKPVVYMPHSPTAMADEYEMLERAGGRSVSRTRWRFLLEDEARLIRAADVIVLPSPGAAGEYERRFSAELGASVRRYIPSGAPRQIATAAPLASSPLVLFVGRYVEHKGYDLFLDAAETLRRRGSTARFATVGSGDLFRTSDAVEDIGWTDDPASEIALADVVVVPNRVAYFDLLPLEVASLGKPLILTRVGGNIDQLRSLPDSVGAEPTADGIADAVEEALDRSRRSEGFGSANAAVYERSFTIEAMAQNWSSLLDEILDRPTQ